MHLCSRGLSILAFGWFFAMTLCVPSASAQVSAAISGSVKDSTGADVPSVTVTARNVETGAERTTVTDAGGLYKFLALPVGAYEVRAAKEGFNEAIRTGLHLSLGQQANVDIALQVGDVAAQITITEEASPVTTTTADISGLVAEQQVKDLPLNG